MQIGGVGSGHDTYSHQVTNCLHEHTEARDPGSMGAGSGAQEAVQQAAEALQDNSAGNLFAWVQNIGNGGKRLLKTIWGENKDAGDSTGTAASGGSSIAAGQEMTVTGTSVGVKTTVSKAAMETAATHTYFRPVEDRADMSMTPLQRVRYQIQKVTRKLMDRLPGR